MGSLWATVSVGVLLCNLAFECTRAAEEVISRCLPLSDLTRLSQPLNLSAEERAILPDLCIPSYVEFVASVTQGPPLRQGIPAGVQCESYKWCDSEGICTMVCKRGTVQVDPWFKWASEWQRTLTKELPMCYSSIVGSHNAAITLADGYGNEDLYWQRFFKYIPKAYMTGDKLLTNNQWLSVTDQLNLGARLIEVDVHWVKGALRLGHCGGLHSPALNWLLRALNTLSKLAGQHIRWDTETVGCNPSLSSIPTSDLRLLSDLFQEVFAWMAAPEHADEFVILFFDDEMDLKTWGKVGLLINQMLAAFPAEWIFTPFEKEFMFPGPWPSIRQLLNAGKRLMTVSRTDYKAVMHTHIFSRNETCGWTEPRLSELSSPPTCEYCETLQTSQSGNFYRVNDCKLLYGPLNCQFAPISDMDSLDLLTGAAITTATQCAWNSVSPDLITPDLILNTIWSWAPGEPASLPTSLSQQPAPTSARLRRTPEGAQAPPPDPPRCVSLSQADGRWRVADCKAAMPAACRAKVHLNASFYNESSLWALGTLPPPPRSQRTTLGRLQTATASAAHGILSALLGSSSPWSQWLESMAHRLSNCGGVECAPAASDCDTCCPDGFEYGFPLTPKENEKLVTVLRQENVASCFIKLVGPLFSPL